MRGVLGSLAATAVALGVAIGSSPAHADPFGPMRVGFTFDSAPGYTIGSTTGSLIFGQTLTTTSVTPASASPPTTGNANGGLTFSLTVGDTIFQTLTSVFTFDDPLGGLFSFTADKVETTGFSTDGEGDDNIALYLLGHAGGGHANATPSPTSVILSFAYVYTGVSTILASQSNTLANPPDPDPYPQVTPPPAVVPEPATVALLGAGLVALGMRRRRR